MTLEMNILADATIPSLQDWFALPFNLNFYHSTNDLKEQLRGQDILICRSTLRVNQDLLDGSDIQCVATASSGTDHIDHEYLKQAGIMLFDAKGCNATSVADYVLSTLAYLYQNKSIKDQRVGIIGMGEVGSRVKKRLDKAGCAVYCYDPIREHLDNTFKYCSLSDLNACDIICVHANLHDAPPFPSRDLLDGNFLNTLRPNTIIVNASRGGIVNESALLACQIPLIYCTDVYNNEPSIDSQIVNYATLCTPHIAGHSIEAKQNAVRMISDKLHHHYDLTTPSDKNSLTPQSQINGGDLFSTYSIQPSENRQSPWQELVLKAYNPLTETLELKQNRDKKQSFLTLRKAHKNRHDFICYNPNYSLFID